MGEIVKKNNLCGLEIWTDFIKFDVRYRTSSFTGVGQVIYIFYYYAIYYF